MFYKQNNINAVITKCHVLFTYLSICFGGLLFWIAHSFLRQDLVPGPCLEDHCLYMGQDLTPVTCAQQPTDYETVVLKAGQHVSPFPHIIPHSLSLPKIELLHPVQWYFNESFNMEVS